MLSFFAAIGALTCLCIFILVAMHIKHHFEEKAMFGDPVNCDHPTTYDIAFGNACMVKNELTKKQMGAEIGVCVVTENSDEAYKINGRILNYLDKQEGKKA